MPSTSSGRRVASASARVFPKEPEDGTPFERKIHWRGNQFLEGRHSFPLGERGGGGLVIDETKVTPKFADKRWIGKKNLRLGFGLG